MILGQKYWTFYKNPTGYTQVVHATYRADHVDALRSREKRIYLTKQEAQAASTNTIVNI